MNYTYDKAGNRLTRTKTNGTNEDDTYRYYPGTNRLHTVTGTHAELFAYDADGNTTQRSHKAATTTPIYHYDQSGQLLAETDATGAMIKAYVWLHGQPLAQITPDGSVYYYHNDHLGTPQRLTDTTGAIVWAADYLPFGKADVTISTVGNNLRFAGQYYDSETGLHYNYHRYYDSHLGRYLRADPIGLTGGINLFIFANNNPINLVDPFGLVSGSFNGGLLRSGSYASLGSRGITTSNYAFGCSCSDRKMSCSFSVNSKITIVPNTDPIWHNSAWDRRYGNTSGTLSSRYANVLSHERDHQLTYADYYFFVLSKLEGEERKTFASKCDCKKRVTEIKALVKKNFSIAVGHSGSFDSAKWNSGNQYGAHPLTGLVWY